MKRAAVCVLALSALCAPTVLQAQEASFPEAAEAELRGIGQDFLRKSYTCVGAPFAVPMRVTIIEMAPSTKFTERETRYITNEIATALAKDAARLPLFEVMEERLSASVGIAKIMENRGGPVRPSPGEPVEWFVVINPVAQTKVHVAAYTVKKCMGPERFVPADNIPDDFDKPDAFWKQAAPRLDARLDEIGRLAVALDVDRRVGDGASARATAEQWQRDLRTAIMQAFSDWSRLSAGGPARVPFVDLQVDGTPQAGVWRATLHVDRSPRGTVEVSVEFNHPDGSQRGFVAGQFAPDSLPAADVCGGPLTESFASQCHVPLTAGQERGLKPKQAFVECENCPEMVVVPAGRFTMGSPDGDIGEGPPHVVTIGKPFAVGRVHVTRDQFAAFVKEAGYAAGACYSWPTYAKDGSWRDPGFAQEGSHPVVCVNWDDAQAYAGWLARKTGKPYRLLSEAEWEYAARGQTQPGNYPRFWFGDDDKAFCRNGNGADRTARDSIAGPIIPCDDGHTFTSPAGHYAPNAFGLYDMAGNAWQWTLDCHHHRYDGAPSDGSAVTTDCEDSRHMARGGSFYSGPAYLRAAARLDYEDAVGEIGFRVARTLVP